MHGIPTFLPQFQVELKLSLTMQSPMEGAGITTILEFSRPKYPVSMSSPGQLSATEAIL